MPWCPKCGSEYRDGFTECASCGVKLVDKLTDEQKKQAEMEERRDMVLPEGMSRPVVVFTAKNRLEAESIEDMLRDNDIPVFDRPAAFRQIQSYSGADARFGVELVVDASQTARARQLIDEMQTELSENELSEDDLARLAEEQAEQMPKAEVEDSASLRLLPIIAGVLVLALVVLYFVTR
ncbi:putative signal transducing protein [Agathobaculum sp.]|uniref:putative signal transducing protein n=1 Tax=Agathobaculum sp. TaxID=2048138 RepID=UPI003AEF3E3D